MKFFKFLLQVLAMGLCFVAGMIYEKNILQKTSADDVNTDISIEKNAKDDIVIDEMPIEPMNQQDIINDESDLNSDSGDMLIDNNTVNIDNMQMQNINNEGQQQVQPQVPGQPMIQEQQTGSEEQIIINNVEPIDYELDDSNNAIQPTQDTQGQITTNKDISGSSNTNVDTNNTNTTNPHPVQ